MFESSYKGRFKDADYLKRRKYINNSTTIVIFLLLFI